MSTVDDGPGLVGRFSCGQLQGIQGIQPLYAPGCDMVLPALKRGMFRIT